MKPVTHLHSKKILPAVFCRVGIMFIFTDTNGQTIICSFYLWWQANSHCSSIEEKCRFGADESKIRAELKETALNKDFVPLFLSAIQSNQIVCEHKITTDCLQIVDNLLQSERTHPTNWQTGIFTFILKPHTYRREYWKTATSTCYRKLISMY